MPTVPSPEGTASPPPRPAALAGSGLKDEEIQL